MQIILTFILIAVVGGLPFPLYIGGKLEQIVWKHANLCCHLQNSCLRSIYPVTHTKKKKKTSWHIISSLQFWVWFQVVHAFKLSKHNFWGWRNGSVCSRPGFCSSRPCTGWQSSKTSTGLDMTLHDDRGQGSHGSHNLRSQKMAPVSSVFSCFVCLILFFACLGFLLLFCVCFVSLFDTWPHSVAHISPTLVSNLRDGIIPH